MTGEEMERAQINPAALLSGYLNRGRHTTCAGIPLSTRSTLETLLGCTRFLCESRGGHKLEMSGLSVVPVGTCRSL